MEISMRTGKSFNKSMIVDPNNFHINFFDINGS